MQRVRRKKRLMVHFFLQAEVGIRYGSSGLVGSEMFIRARQMTAASRAIISPMLNAGLYPQQY